MGAGMTTEIGQTDLYPLEPGPKENWSLMRDGQKQRKIQNLKGEVTD